jgi:hypothetical protein
LWLEAVVIKRQQPFRETVTRGGGVKARGC